MNQFTPVDPAHAEGKAKALLDAVKRKLGIVPNMTRHMARSPAVLDAYLAFAGALAGGSLGAKLREQIALVTAEENGCEYCLSAHAAIGKAAGLTATDVADARRADATDARARAALRFARTLVLQRRPRRRRGRRRPARGRIHGRRMRRGDRQRRAQRVHELLQQRHASGRRLPARFAARGRAGGLSRCAGTTRASRRRPQSPHRSTRAPAIAASGHPLIRRRRNVAFPLPPRWERPGVRVRRPAGPGTTFTRRSRMTTPTTDVAFTPAVKAIQSRRGSRAGYRHASRTRGGWSATITPDLAAFIAEPRLVLPRHRQRRGPALHPASRRPAGLPARARRPHAGLRRLRRQPPVHHRRQPRRRTRARSSS